MATEIERKFLIHQPPFDQWDEGTQIFQGYLARGSQAMARVRIAGTQAWLTIKGQTMGISRPEFEYRIPIEDAHQLLALCEGGIIEKKRWCINYEGHIWEVDVFAGENLGLMLAEIELKSEHEDFSIPPWVTQEVSDDPRYFNGYLSRHPYQSWHA